MNKGKVLVFLRVSTEAQDLQDQKNEMISYVKSYGYGEDDIIFLENKGASAIKLNDKYLEMIDTLKTYIKDKIIDCVAAWHINRLGRSDEVLTELKNIFIKNKIQFICKNPSLVLLNEDGSVNSGTELAFGLFSILVKQDFEEKKEKFKRAKSSMAKQSKYTGGNVIRFGYKVDSNNFFVENKEESEIVKLAFRLYATGEYSTRRLSEELNSRGYKRNGKPFSSRFWVKTLSSISYTGLPDEKHNMRVYPPLISKELYDACQKISKSNRKGLRQGDKITLCSKLIKCSECGGTFTSTSVCFRCNNKPEGKCNNGLTINQTIIDNIAWRVACKEHIDYLVELSENNTQAYQERLSVIEQKTSTLKGIIEDTDIKKKRIVDSFIEGYIDKKERDLRLSKIQDDILIHQKEINALEEERNTILGLLDNVDKELNEWIYYDALDTVENSVRTDEDRYRIIHKHIVKIIPQRIQYGKRAADATRDNAISIEIYTAKGDIKKFIFLPMSRKGDNLLTYHDDKEIWLGERLTKGGN